VSPGLDAITGEGAYGPAGRLAPTSGPVDAVIATTVASTDEDVYVLTPNATQRTGPCRWTPRVDSMGTWLMPVEGDPCVIQSSTLGHFTVLWWQPATVRAGLLIGEAVGDIKFTARTTWPAWWLLCDARALTVAMGFPTLRAALIADGSPYGTSGADPRLPPLSGRAPIGAGTGSGLTARVAGATVGEETHQLTTAELAAHTHTTPPVPRDASGWQGDIMAAGAAYWVPRPTDNSGVDGAMTVTDSAGGGSTHNTMQPSLVLNAIIRT
jgi:microcystin-dependent protein